MIRKMDKYQSQIPANAKPGQFARFNALGRFLQLEDRPTNGLGILFQVQLNGRLARAFY